VQDSYGEINRGLYIVRGENVAWVGEVDPDREDLIEEGQSKLSKVEYEEIEKRLDEVTKSRKKQEKVRSKKLVHDFGILTEPFQDNMY
jgi:U6 snRNA-associated Sm-like protein LSm1